MKFGPIARWTRLVLSAAIGKNGRWISGLAILGLVSFFFRHQVVQAAADAPIWLLGGIGAFLALCFVFVALPNMLVRGEDIGEAELLKLRNDVRVAGIQILGGAVVLGGLVFTYQTLELNRQGQITERFTEATNQLGNPELDTRLGGIYALARIAQDSQDDARPIIAVLTAYLRHHAPWSASSDHVAASAAPSLRTAAADIRAVVTVLRRLLRPTEQHVPTDYADCIDLSAVDLGGVDFSGLSLVGADLSGSNLADAKLASADLSGASLAGADLTNSRASDVVLARADLRAAKLVSADLNNATLTDGFLTDANLFKTKLANADLKRADLRGANFSEANLTAAKLDDADLRDTDLFTARGLLPIDSPVTNEQTKIRPGLTIRQRHTAHDSAPPKRPCEP